MNISKKQKIFLWVLSPILLLLSFGSLESSGGLAAFWFLLFIAAVFLGLSSPLKTENTKTTDVAKPNLLILLPIYLFMEKDVPFVDSTQDTDDEKIQVIGTYSLLFKMYCYNRLLVQKFGADIYFSTIVEKQRERIAAGSLAFSEHYVALMRMFQELEQLAEKENSDFEGMVSFALIRKEKEFSDVKEDDENGGPWWMMKITEVFKEDKETIDKYFQIYWNNSGFNQKELETWLSQ